MPTYQYRCTSCDRQLEVVQKFTDPSLTECPECSGALKKIFNAVGVVFKGSGFYRTDSRDASGGNSAGSRSADSGNGDSSGSDSDSKDSGGKESSSGSTGSKEAGGKDSGTASSSKQSGGKDKVAAATAG